MLNLKDHFIQALKTHPKFSDAHLQLALLYKEEGDDKNTIKHFESAISADIEAVERSEEKGDELMKNFQFQNAKEQFVKSQEKKIHCAEVYSQQSNYYIVQGQNKLAQSALRNCIKMNPTQAKAHRDLGLLLIDEKQLDDARLHLEKSIDIDYSDSKSHFNLGMIMIIMKDFEDAEQHFLSALDINPKFADCMVELAQLKLRMKQDQEAKEYYIKAKEITPKLKHPELEKIMN